MKNTKIIALYLPQFHEIPENNEWWWNGFTEWTNVKKTQPLFKWHEQPRIPLDENYYDLTNANSLKWQVDLANKYWINWFCFYHYRFHWKKLLEKPVELFLNNKDLNLDFCLSWANEPWTRNWDGKNKSILVDQKYWNKEDWLEHYNYLLNFFSDDRYIKLDNKPVYLIYRTVNNKEILEEMFTYWNQLSIENWFDWIHIIETISHYQDKPYLEISESVVEFEPLLSVNNLNFIYKIPNYFRAFFNKFCWMQLLLHVDYDLIWKNIIKRNKEYWKKKNLWWFVWWDNTPRRWKKGFIIKWANPSKFWYYLEKQINKSKIDNNDFLFINAWNEWAEWAYLEPDELNKYGYLENILKNNPNN